jgi:hypothetical protein
VTPMRVPVWRAVRGAAVTWGLGAAVAAAQTAAPLPQVAVPPINITLPNYSSVAVGEIGSLEANASLVRANDSSTAWYNPAGLGLATQSSVSGSAGTFQVGRIRPEEVPSSGGSFQQIPSTVGFTIKNLFGNPDWAGGLSIAHVNAWSQSLSTAQGVVVDPNAGRLMYSGVSDMSGWMANLAVARRTGRRLRLGASLDVQKTDIDRDGAQSALLLTGTDLGSFLVDSRVSASVVHLRGSVGAHYDITPAFRLGALVRTPGLAISRSGSFSHEGAMSVGTSTTTASFFEPGGDVEYRVPFEFKVGLAVLLERVQVEVDVNTWTGGDPYAAFRSTATWTIVTDPGNGSAPTVQTPALAAPIVDPAAVINVAIGGQYRLNASGSWMIHGGFATDRSPVGPEDTFFTKAHMQALTVGVSGRTTLILGSVGLRYQWGTTGEVSLRRFQDSSQLKTRFKLSTIGIVYSVGLLF